MPRSSPAAVSMSQFEPVASLVWIGRGSVGVGKFAGRGVVFAGEGSRLVPAIFGWATGGSARREL